MTPYLCYTVVTLSSVVALTACSSLSKQVEIMKVPKITELRGMRDPRLPHPGAIEWVYLWNDSKQFMPVANWPERMAWYCEDTNHAEVSHSDSRANACIPIVKIVTLSLDEHGAPVAPKDADFIEAREYGPNDVFVRSTVTPPSLKKFSKRSPPLSEFAPPVASPPLATTSTLPSLTNPPVPGAKRMSFWTKIRQLFRST
jgi:hypothetical protein